MDDEVTRLLRILDNGSDRAVVALASDIAALIRRLSSEHDRAARLLAAVEGLEQRLRTGDTDTGYAALSASVDYANAGMLAGFGLGKGVTETYTEQGRGSLADALIALGEQTNDQR